MEQTFMEFTVAEIGPGFEAFALDLDAVGLEVTGEANEVGKVKVGDIVSIWGDRDRVLERLERCKSDWNVYLRPR
jgi:hypothetical protein